MVDNNTNVGNNTNVDNNTNWDYEHPVIKPPVHSSRVVVSVSLNRQEYDEISRYAEMTGKKVSTFLKEAALREGRFMSEVRSLVLDPRVNWTH